jgi:acetate kinase
MKEILLAFNKGSATLKVAAYALGELGAPRFQLTLDMASRQVDARGQVPEELQAFDPDQDITDIVALIACHAAGPDGHLVAMAHRIVHGGHRQAPEWITDALVNDLEDLEVMCPLQQPPALEVLCHLRELWPEIPHLAVFDTAFHRQQPALATTYALPASVRMQGVTAQGYHGISCQHVLRQLRARHPLLVAGRVLVAHLGHSSTMTAVHNGRSVATSMGFSTLDGLPMGTRSGQLDPGVLLYLLEQGWNKSRLTDLLYHQSGLLGLSGTSACLRDLLASDCDSARFAVDYFCYRAARMAASLACAMEGLETIVFTGGIGENLPEIRSNLCRRLAWLGVALDDEANAGGNEVLDRPESRCRLLVVPADEAGEMSLQCEPLLAHLPHTVLA